MRDEEILSTNMTDVNPISDKKLLFILHIDNMTMCKRSDKYKSFCFGKKIKNTDLDSSRQISSKCLTADKLS